MTAFDASRELPVWIGGVAGAFVTMAVAFWRFRRRAHTDTTTIPRSVTTTNPATAVFFHTFASAFIGCALLQDFCTVFFPSFYVPLSAFACNFTAPP